MSKYKISFSAGQFLLKEVGLFFKNLAFEFLDKGCQKSAAALTYMTLFALVPLMTVTFSMFSVIPAFDGVAEQLQTLIFTHFIPETGSEVQRYLGDFSAQARRLTGAGVGILVVTAYLMLTNIEKTFNAIWGVQQARRGLASFLLYWAVLSIGPLLLGAGMVMTTYLVSLRMLMRELDQLGISTMVFSLVPLLLTSAAFTLLFAAVPNCRVPLKFAVIGGVTTAICFELLKMAFGWMVANSSFQLIYGAFAVVPLFLLWINFVWTIVLGGAVFVRTLAEHGYADRSRRQSDLQAMLRSLAVFREKSKTGEAVTDRDCVRAGVSLVHWQHLRSLMVKNRWIAVTDTGNYVLSRELKSVTLWDAARLVKLQFDDITAGKGREAKKAEDSAKPWLREYGERLEKVRADAEDVFSIDLDTLFSQ